ncbi:MAG TPA: hypothetical protein VEB19_07820 [Gemmatimonadaceae bacterium]|nr:hypothetical protein [Gemmatimonadaceae bacterium]
MFDRDRPDPHLRDARIKLRAVIAALDDALEESAEEPVATGPTLAEVAEEIAVHRDALDIIAQRQQSLGDATQPGGRQVPFRELDRVRTELEQLQAEALALTQALAKLEALRDELEKTAR